MHSFMLIAITSILCPSTPNTLGFDYLYFLNSPASIQEYDWVSHILNQIQSSIRKYQAYIHTFKDDSQSGSHYFLGCLPLLAISSFSMLSVLLVYLFFKYFHLSFISHIVLFFLVSLYIRISWISTFLFIRSISCVIQFQGFLLSVERISNMLWILIVIEKVRPQDLVLAFYLGNICSPYILYLYHPISRHQLHHIVSQAQKCILEGIPESFMELKLLISILILLITLLNAKKCTMTLFVDSSSPEVCFLTLFS
ncbi:hypothetical protein GQ55_5G362600 [Panicum hallii var. hallii]|uniref:Uncharacterized protein n=1 Tax=Panicum hallii var. hallii TaxID=1504633 RepID=A0A2T7DMI1_9POAL|nr:hypothetical protein GQ55_5G362600 [Panicum hallii var. hallii]